jgi:hypothetical protein
VLYAIVRTLWILRRILFVTVILICLLFVIVILRILFFVIAMFNLPIVCYSDSKETLVCISGLDFKTALPSDIAKCFMQLLWLIFDRAVMRFRLGAEYVIYWKWKRKGWKIASLIGWKLPGIFTAVVSGNLLVPLPSIRTTLNSSSRLLKPANH